MAADFPSVMFAKVDVDANRETRDYCGVSWTLTRTPNQMPMFQLFVEGVKVAETKGMNEQGLRVLFLFFEPIACST